MPRVQRGQSTPVYTLGSSESVHSNTGGVIYDASSCVKLGSIHPGGTSTQHSLQVYTIDDSFVVFTTTTYGLSIARQGEHAGHQPIVDSNSSTSMTAPLSGCRRSVQKSNSPHSSSQLVQYVFSFMWSIVRISTVASAREPYMPASKALRTRSYSIGHSSNLTRTSHWSTPRQRHHPSMTNRRMAQVGSEMARTQTLQSMNPITLTTNSASLLGFGGFVVNWHKRFL